MVIGGTMGEVDIVYLGPGEQKPVWIGEIKWSDRIESHSEEELRGLTTLIRRHKTITDGFITTKTIDDDLRIENRPVQVVPSAAYCYIVGRNITSNLSAPIAFGQSKAK